MTTEVQKIKLMKKCHVDAMTLRIRPLLTIMTLNITIKSVTLSKNDTAHNNTHFTVSFCRVSLSENDLGCMENKIPS
jgi:hypothetical protein